MVIAQAVVHVCVLETGALRGEAVLLAVRVEVEEGTGGSKPMGPTAIVDGLEGLVVEMEWGLIAERRDCAAEATKRSIRCEAEHSLGGFRKRDEIDLNHDQELDKTRHNLPGNPSPSLCGSPGGIIIPRYLILLILCGQPWRLRRSVVLP